VLEYRSRLEANHSIELQTPALRIAQAQHEAGAIGALEAIDAERTAHRLAVVALNKALGGGWEVQSIVRAQMTTNVENRLRSAAEHRGTARGR
jgi:hypothetical protein